MHENKKTFYFKTLLRIARPYEINRFITFENL